jgi:hypothetical protein
MYLTRRDEMKALREELIKILNIDKDSTNADIKNSVSRIVNINAHLTTQLMLARFDISMLKQEATLKESNL